MQNDKTISLSEYLKAEKKEARDDWKARLGFEEEVRDDYVKYSNLVTLATSRSELEEVSKKVRSRIRVFEELEVDKPFYLGEVPEGYLTPSWSNIAKTWKPKYIVIQKDIKFNLKTLPEGKAEPQQTQNSNPPYRPKTKRIPFETLLRQDKFPKIKSKLEAHSKTIDSGKSVIILVLALEEISALTIPSNQSAFWESVNIFFGTTYKVQYYSPEYKKVKESINKKSQDPELFSRFRKICDDLSLTEPD